MIGNIRAHLQKHKDFKTMMRDGLERLNDSKPWPIGLLLGSMQFAGGWYLFVPIARFLPPFNKLFETLPPWFWATYFVMSGIVAMVSSLMPDDVCYLPARFAIAIWMFANWFFLTATSLLTAVWILNNGQGAVSYGIALAFFPCLALAAFWKAVRVRQILADELAEELEQKNHVRELKNAAVARDERLEASGAPLEF